MFNLFRITPGWIKDVQSNGKAAKALVVSNPKDHLKGVKRYEDSDVWLDVTARGVKGYEGSDVWLDVTTRIEPPGEPPFEARMKCQLSQIVFGMLEAGMSVNAKYDPAHKERVVLVDDQHTLLQYRAKK